MKRTIKTEHINEQYLILTDKFNKLRISSIKVSSFYLVTLMVIYTIVFEYCANINSTVKEQYIPFYLFHSISIFILFFLSKDSIRKYFNVYYPTHELYKDLKEHTGINKNNSESYLYEFRELSIITLKNGVIIDGINTAQGKLVKEIDMFLCDNYCYKYRLLYSFNGNAYIVQCFFAFNDDYSEITFSSKYIQLLKINDSELSKYLHDEPKLFDKYFSVR